MPSTAILIGNANYDHQNPLPCCIEDVAAMRALLEATGRFEKVHALTDLDADAMRSTVRDALPPDGKHDEVLFYFSGHGAHISGHSAQTGPELYLCGTKFDGSRPNETGFRHEELMDLFRAAEPSVLVTIIDACHSGALLVKGHRPLKPVEKGGLRNVLQFSSSLDDQMSLGGEQLSAFTLAFLKAAVRKAEGVVYYTDISNTLRDDFIENDEQTPFFVNQGTGREALVDDACKLVSIREKLTHRWRSSDDEIVENSNRDEEPLVIRPITQKELFIAAEGRMGSPDKAENIIDGLFDKLIAKFEETYFVDFFEIKTIEHSTYRESVFEEFMVKVLSRESRPDRLVTAEIRRQKKEQNVYERAAFGFLPSLSAEWTEVNILKLNCKLTRAQIVFTLIPKFNALQQLKIYISCAPSLNNIYIFDIITQNPKVDWGSFDEDGREIVRHWYKVGWNTESTSITERICDTLTKVVRDYIDETTKRLEDERS